MKYHITTKEVTINIYIRTMFTSCFLNLFTTNNISTVINIANTKGTKTDLAIIRKNQKKNNVRNTIQVIKTFSDRFVICYKLV